MNRCKETLIYMKTIILFISGRGLWTKSKAFFRLSGIPGHIKVAVNKEDLGDGQVQIQQMVFRTLKRGGEENEWIAELVLQTR
ncbi:hypothetical protein AB9M93_08805 [Peribacillus frigoritolerans]|jgi:hypothetical protein|uniref:hypothetical protein n=1 Tax=Peribacillus frigoritolerans TaxID=450367 RepID=UPI003515EB3A